MPDTRIVRPETVRLDISGGDWLLVKRRLNAGEQRRQYARAWQRLGNGDGRLQVNPLETGMALILAYLLDWSLVDEAGNCLTIRDTADDEAAKEAALNAIDYGSFVEIKEAIEAHERKNDAETAAKKKTLTGSPGVDPTSPSLAGADGATSGSPS